jgi:hypothetical protein
LLVIQRPTETIRCNQAAPQTQSVAISRNQAQSGTIMHNQTQSDAISMPGALCFRVFVFWAGRKGLCFVFLCFEPAQRACVLCFRVLADPPQNTGGSQHPVLVLLAVVVPATLLSERLQVPDFGELLGNHGGSGGHGIACISRQTCHSADGS